MTTVNVRGLIDLVIDGRTPDGSPATDDVIDAAIYLALDHDERLCELLCLARHGRRINGDEVGWDERTAALDELEKLRAVPLDRPVDDEVIAMAEEAFATADAGDRSARRTLAEHHLGDGRALKSVPRRRANARALLEEASAELGYEPEELLRPVPRGHLREDELVRRDALARAVDRARAAGATLAAIGTVIGIPKQRVFDLCERGRELDAG